MTCCVAAIFAATTTRFCLRGKHMQSDRPVHCTAAHGPDPPDVCGAGADATGVQVADQGTLWHDGRSRVRSRCTTLGRTCGHMICKRRRRAAGGVLVASTCLWLLTPIPRARHRHSPHRARPDIRCCRAGRGPLEGVRPLARHFSVMNDVANAVKLI